ncbi:hypothetical protein EQO05_11255 [Methanosarcina sp. MSH10X1]|uniref:hypothetical protein n=1 Tax=Methanosarcina sp. MSH10X1 TaxID=2507075 RepID=UPI000FFBC4EA|nr:hypothetical protein [Methanosarcina sp. MSH10X1]RXA18264.1 hypothetical protein EQO05_11255 [Methanosarcina sp. MSH10X1]
MKCQKRPEERKRNPTPVRPTGTCRPEYGPSSDNSLFRYSIVETHPIHYEYGSNPVWTAFTVSAFSGLLAETNLTMKDPENYFKCAEKYSQSKKF